MNVPIESAELAAPLRIHYVRIRRDSGGVGRCRGGCGFEKEYECLNSRMMISHRGERHFTQPWGQAGGGAGASSRSIIVRTDGSEQVVPSKMNIELRRGDRLRLWTTGGGGYGNPLDRPVSSVLRDVIDGKVSANAARESYGVLLDDDRADESKTAQLREAMRARPAP
jgi:N-methylhydantoinase B